MLDDDPNAPIYSKRDIILMIILGAFFVGFLIFIAFAHQFFEIINVYGL